MWHTKLVTATTCWLALMSSLTVLRCCHLVNGIRLYALNHQKLFHHRSLHTSSFGLLTKTCIGELASCWVVLWWYFSSIILILFLFLFYSRELILFPLPVLRSLFPFQFLFQFHCNRIGNWMLHLNVWPVWRSGSVICRMNEVALRWAQLVLGWVTIFRRVYHLGV